MAGIQRMSAWAVAGAAVLCAATPGSAAPAANAGARLFLRCQTCHQVKAGTPNKVGPNLHGFFGKKAGSVAGFNYSAAMRKSGITWDQPTLDKWLIKPSALVPGTTMAFVGLPKPEERAALIAYLQQVTK